MTAPATGAAGAPAGTAGRTPAPDAFLRDLTALIRAGDHYGRLDSYDTDRLLKPYLTSSLVVRPDGSCAADALAVERVRTFFQAVAAGIERAAGVMTAVAVDVNGEGFGRVFVLAGRLVAIAESMRDAGRFAFADVPALAAAGDALVARAVAVLAVHPEVARDDS